MGINPSSGTNDPLPEIPPFESNLKFQYRFFNNRFVPEIRLRMVAAQKRISPDYHETPSVAFSTLDFNLVYLFGKNLKVRAGVSNIFNTSYYEHLNRNQIGSQIPLYEMGRSFYLNLTFNL
jgi:outer membrane receptor protein involved in Fe transport